MLGFHLFTFEFINMDQQLFIDILGWGGGIALVIAFGLNSMGKIEAQSKSYQFLNLFGGIALIANTAFYGAFPSTFVNVIWVFIAMVALWKIFEA